MPGFLAYEGPSLIDGAPIVVAVTLDSNNTKTGPMAQAWILRTDMHPVAATSDGHDDSICGGCIHRGDKEAGRTRTCYVNVAWAPSQVYKAYRQGNYYSPFLPSVVPPIRLGAYGDPLAIPLRVWEKILRRQEKPAWTGYTHLWKDARKLGHNVKLAQRLVMASVDSRLEQNAAVKAGWRTFRVRTVGQRLLSDEIVCPASDEAGHKVKCIQCRLCMGTSKPAKSIAIYVHGTAERTGTQRLQQPQLFYKGDK